MKEKILDLLRVSTYYPRKLIDKIIYKIYVVRRNDWSILDPFMEKPVLIVGNGPSLNKTPLDKINESFVSIGMNKINLLYDSTSWRPDILICVNGLVINQNKEYFNSTDAPLILPVRALYLGIKPRKNVLFVKLTDKEVIQSNIKKSLSTGCTVTYTALQLAAYLNPESVNIVGVDHNFVVEKGPLVQKMEGDDVNHFSKDYFKGNFWGLPDLEGSEKLYKISKDYFTSMNVKITDYTVDGKLQIFEKGDIKDLLTSHK